MSELPQHVGFIVDGNRRWAKEHGLDSFEGHKAGYEALKEVLIDLLHRGVTYASAYTFSTENWKRSRREVNYLMGLFVDAITEDEPLFRREGVRVRILGSRDRLSNKVIQAIEHIEQVTKHLQRGQLLLCFNYGGQQEVVEAIRGIMAMGLEGSQVTSETVAEYLYAADVPPCDLIVRTGGDQRLSNFMMWRSVYSELMFLDKYWPDMTTEDITSILDEYTRRQRRFGK